MALFVRIGFLTITLWDIIDIAVVGILIYQVYHLLKGSLAFNIFSGIILLYVVGWFVERVQMSLLSAILGQLLGVGVILLLIVFQPEVRRFLLILGRGILMRRPQFLRQWIKGDGYQNNQEKEKQVQEVLNALDRMSHAKVGALILFSSNPNLTFSNSGELINATISARLIESIFSKESPLHDGAMIIADGKILAASCVLPVSDSPDIPQSKGLRHRAAVGGTEGNDVLAVIVSEETGGISTAKAGALESDLSRQELHSKLHHVFDDFYIPSTANTK